MNTQLKLSLQEMKVIDYLQSKNNSPVLWEELAQFAKDPQNVKQKTVQKTVSEIKRKYASAGLPAPFNVKFSSIINEPKQVVTEQKLVQIKKTLGGNTMLVDDKKKLLPAQIDFVLDRNMKRVKTRNGYHLLNDEEWEMMKYFNENVGRFIKISELRDKVKYPHFGSKLPPRWYDSIMRVINNLRRTIPDLKNRLITTKISDETNYLFQ